MLWKREGREKEHTRTESTWTESTYFLKYIKIAGKKKDPLPGTRTKYFTILPDDKLVNGGSSINWSPITSVTFREILIRDLNHQQENNAIIRLQTLLSSELPNKVTCVLFWALGSSAFQSHWSLPFLCALRTAYQCLQSSSALSALRSLYTFPNMPHWCWSKLRLNLYLTSASL